MKKIFLLCAFVLCAFCLHAQDNAEGVPTIGNTEGAPTFDKGTVIDVSAISGTFRKIEFLDLTDCGPYTLHVYGWDDRTANWIYAGDAFLKGFGDDDDVDGDHTQFARRIGICRYFGIETDAKSALTFGTPIMRKSGRIRVTIKSENAFVVTRPATAPADGSAPTFDGGTVIDAGSVGGMFDEIEFVDYTTTGPHSLRVFAYDNNAGQWVYAGSVYLRGYGDDDDVDGEHTPLDGHMRAFRYFGIEAEEGASLKFIANPYGKRARVIDDDWDGAWSDDYGHRKDGKLRVTVTQ